MLFRNGENLKKELIQYLTGKQKITIIVPYIKAPMLASLLKTPNLKCDQIIVRWEARDLITGASDLDIYNICKENGIYLYMNNRIHLKLYTNNFKDAFLGSANISERAISTEKYHFNYEVCTYVNLIDRSDRLYLHKILNDSILINDEIFKSIEDQIPNIDLNIENNLFDLPMTDKKNDSDFLISKLPMIDTPNLLWELYSGKIKTESEVQENCLCHDLTLYTVQPEINSKNDFLEILSKNFFDHSFISSFLLAVDTAPSKKMRNGRTKEGLQFGAVTRWFTENTTTAPTPKPFELQKNVQILYVWIEYLSKGKYSIIVPGRHSQVLKKNF